ncbi:RHS repeat-associated core domain-containing protein [Streptomyces sp. WMMC897]|uniref:RHS repeat-associated core domain-containing protein n=1 Tax=Streptomyces sp. WMMC897 TaxID=3014782 RepID=UPI0022B73BCA|nr:RHS repeat-associated core domain-containing protein [Streptomyces sp. WMMC897]MCZ7414109.1 polymorphic toxin-type HINT domain-containing protein [Streptomyces sp. WMMC897]
MKSFRGRLLTRRIPRRAVGPVAIGLSLAVTTGLVQLVYFDDSGDGRPDVQDLGDPAEGRNAEAKPRGSDPARDAAVTTLGDADWPEAASATVRVGAGNGDPTVIGGLPVTVTTADTDAADPASVRVSSLGREQAAETGSAALLKVTRTDGEADAAPVELSVDYSEFAEAYGGGYGARLRLVELPECAVFATPGSEKCPDLPKPLPTRNDTGERTLTATVEAQGAEDGLSTQAVEPTPLLAVSAGDSSAQGDYKATPLSPSAEWSVAKSSGGFSWNYPFRTVPTPGGLKPSIGLSYSSQAVDGRTSATNNQGSWIGEGFSYEPGYIERRYKPCKDDGHDNSAEQCWAFDNATIMLDGASGELIKDDDTGKWHLTGENGARIEKLTGATNGDDNGEHWKVTTTDGTEYHFGLNRRPGWSSGDEVTNSTWTTPVFGDDSGEPCYDATFADAHCKQAWRWNLDYVKDTHGNVMSYVYGKETNRYALNGKTDVNGTAYTRGGYLKRIDYGQRDGEVFTSDPAARVVFTTAERCLPTADFDCAAGKFTEDNAAHWPDTPVDRYCKADTKCDASQASATFWTRKRLTGITTQMHTGDGAYQDVDAWTFTHLFTDNGDDSKTLWLSKIDHAGKVGGESALPSLELQGEQLVNRVDKDGDNIAPFHRFRLSNVLTETGTQLDVNYAPTECTADALPEPGEQTKRCYPVRWAPPGYIDPITDWFHKYVVAEIIQTDRTGGARDLVTRYDYQGPAGWRHGEKDGITDEEMLTWDQWQGYGKVTVTSGDGQTMPTRIDYTFLQGLDGDKDPAGGTRTETVTDSTGKTYTGHKEYSGFELEAATYDGGEVVAKTISEPWKHVTATQTKPWKTTDATIVRPRVNRGYKLLSDGSWRETKATTTFDTSVRTGRATEIEELGDVSTTEDDTCTRMWYADNPAQNMYELPSRSEKVSVACSATPDRATQVLADERTAYDGGAFGDAPTKGDPTTTERMTSHDGTTATYQETGTTAYDAFGRPTSQTDAGGATTTTEYTDVGGLISQTKVTNALGHVTTTDYAPAWGQSSGQTDPNGKRTDLAYDPMGRLVSVWMPDRATSQTPSIKYSYDVRADKPVAVKTEKLEIGGTYGVEYQLYDGLLRPRQKQTEGPDGTRMVADAHYDGTGKVWKTTATYNALGAPSSELLLVSDGEVGAQTLSEYDGLGRPTKQTFAVAGAEQWSSTTTYDGEYTHVDPPEGGVPTTTVTNAAGQTTEIRHWDGDTPNPGGAAGPGNGYDLTSYTFTPAGSLETVTDAQGNTWSYEYDQLGRKVKSVDPDAGTATMAYDELDQLVSTTDARGTKTSTVYDQLGRATSTWEGDPETGTKLTETRYDKAGWLGKPYASLRYVNGGSDYFASVVQSVDEYYRPLKTAYQVPDSEGALGGVYTFTENYNRDGTLQSSGMPAVGGLEAETLTYDYDELQRASSMSVNNVPLVEESRYSPTSLLQQLTLNMAGDETLWQTFSYEKGTDRLTRSQLDLGSQEPPVRSADYAYDQVGNILSIADSAGAFPDVQCFAYDTGRRLTEAWTPSADAQTAVGSGTVGGQLGGTSPTACDASPGTAPLGGPAPYWTSYTVDSIGNRTQEVHHDTGLDPAQDVTRTYTYGEGDAGPHAVTKVVEDGPTVDQQFTYAYDATGNTTQRVIGGDTQTLEWNAEGKLSKSTEASGDEATYVYNAGGSRVLRRDATSTTVYLPGMELRLANGSTTVEATRYYSYGGQTVAVRTDDGKLSFLASDHQGTAQLAVDSETGQVAQRRFNPYGQKRGTPTGTWPGEKGYVGGTIDSQTGLTHIGARQYDAELGKFISVDPIIDYTDPQQVNGYAYANNSPVTNSDPSGLLYIGIGAGSGYAPMPMDWWRNKSSNSGPTEDERDAQRDVTRTQTQYNSARQQTIDAAAELVEIAKDVLGINAAMDCFSSGDLAACGETALNIAGSFVGGLAGKILAKYGAPWQWAKGARMVKRVWGLLGDLTSGVKGMWKHSKALSKAKDRLATAKKRARDNRSSRGDEPDSPGGPDRAESPDGPEGGSCPAGNSFVPGTQVLMADGSTKPIEDVELGDKVIATDPETGETEVETVTAEITGSGAKNLVKVTIDLDGDRGEETASVTATDGHPFWVPELDEWLDATDLQSGQWLQTSAGTYVQITAVQRWTQQATVHNLTVSDLHTYYALAGATPVLVHNCGDIYDDLLSEARGRGHEIDPKDKRGQYEYAGRALEKHSGPGRRSYVPGRWPVPEGKRNPQAWNALGRQVQDEIFASLDTVEHYYSRKYKSSLLELRSTDRRGIRYWVTDGRLGFMGFLD